MRKGDGWNQSDSESMADQGPVEMDKSGADYGRRWDAGKIGPNGRGAVAFGKNESTSVIGKPTCIGTPAAATEQPFVVVHSRGNVGFSPSNFAELGPVQKPGKP